ncbi:cholinesterase 1 [Hyalella azteca]|uniref:Carboxylic ester hydrolase n=1 Tax=Hyalella azteca TaxID=294128 RepID=A0A8B7NSA1_HYAAZ|nr:cholinesterase 1 [Hyalella azteca]
MGTSEFNFLPLAILVLSCVFAAETSVVQSSVQSPHDGKALPTDHTTRLGLRMTVRDSEPLVQTTLGLVQGVKEIQGEVAVFAFRGIPFAEAPLDKLRFMPPVPASPWNSTLIANESRSECVQWFGAGEEDCLFLDIYVPQTVLDVNSSLASIVFIHGGGFMFGSTTPYGEAFPLLRHDVIVAMPQYRLGVLGFFSTDDEVAPGNQGLQDQTLALKFLHDNIANFGGDPQRVTIMGSSAGSVSAHFQMVTPAAQGLFSGVLLHSGSITAPWALGRDFNKNAHTIAREFQCRANSSEEIVDCLQQVNAHLLEDTLYLTMEWNGQPFCFAPRVDGQYIPAEPARLLLDGDFTHVPVMMGTVRDEGAIEATELFYLPHFIQSLEENFETNGPISLMLYPDEDPVNTAYTVYDYYIDGNITSDQADNLTRLYTDLFFHVPLDWAVEMMAEQVPVYLHELHHRGVNGYTNFYLEHGLNLSQAANWIAHGDDLQYILRTPSELTTADDIAVSDLYGELWANFAKYGNPTPTADSSSLGFVWPTATADDSRQFLRVTPAPGLYPYYRSASRDFWATLPLRINAIIAGGR